MTPFSSRLSFHLLSLAVFAVFCATATYWAVTLSTHGGAPVPAAAANRMPVTVAHAASLFGSRDQPRNHDVRLFGVLALGRAGAAAIVSVGGEPPRAVSLGGPIGQNMTLSAVRARSVMVRRNGQQSEVFLPTSTSGPTIYVR